MAGEKLKIAFLGGCALSQKNIPEKERMISIVQNILSEKTIDSEYSTFTYSSLLSLNDKVKNEPQIFNANVLVVQIRPQSYNISSKLILKQRIKSKTIFSLNKILFSAMANYVPENSPVEFNTSPLKGKFEELNIIAGRFFHLHEKVAKLLFDKLIDIKEICRLENIYLIILGSPAQEYSRSAKKNNAFLDRFLQEELKDSNICYISCFNEFNDHPILLLNPDGIHLAPEGHHYLGKLIAENILNSILAKEIFPIS